MPLPQQRPENDGVLRYLSQGAEPARVSVVVPPDDVDTWRLGAHPEVVEWLWGRLNAALPADCRRLIAGGAALVHPEAGLVLAAALGTQYGLWLTGASADAAEEAGYASVHAFTTVRRTLDLRASFGPGWFFGRHDDGEATWLAESYRAANL